MTEVKHKIVYLFNSFLYLVFYRVIQMKIIMYLSLILNKKLHENFQKT